jgi:glycosyltransferase involved in cell wall biosynthesis
VKFSLIVATVGRSAELARLFESLAIQTYGDFEVIVVDQNDDDRAKRIVTQYSDRLKLTHLTSPKGLSRARNVGLKYVNGEIVAFPDDDCWYPERMLEDVAKQLSANANLAGITGRSVDESGQGSQGRWATTSRRINKYNVWVCATSYTIFLRTSIVTQIGGFDETLGVGAGTKWGAGEEVNFLLQALRYGGIIQYDPSLCVRHPEPVVQLNARAFERTKLYNRGYGRVLSLNRFPFSFVCYTILRPAAGAVISLLMLDFRRSRYYNISARERYLGWRDR